jgi:hypothetical protein
MCSCETKRKLYLITFFRVQIFNVKCNFHLIHSIIFFHRTVPWYCIAFQWTKWLVQAVTIVENFPYLSETDKCVCFIRICLNIHSLLCAPWLLSGSQANTAGFYNAKAVCVGLRFCSLDDFVMHIYMLTAVLLLWNSLMHLCSRVPVVNNMILIKRIIISQDFFKK